jgi:hypothetical protein
MSFGTAIRTSIHRVTSFSFLPASLLVIHLSLGAGLAFGQSDSLRWNEFRPRVAIDAGHVVKGEYAGDMEFYPLNRTIVVLEQSAAFGEVWEFNAGFKGILWWPFHPGGGRAPYQRNMRGAAALSEASAKRTWGDHAFLEFGFFPYKYNPDAQNLGEYLYRSGTYPGIVRNTDGMHLMNYALFEAYGVHLRTSHWEGVVAHDFNIFSEPTSAPIGDLTPAYEVSVNFPLVQFGAGVAYNRFLSYNLDQTRPNDASDYANGYYQVDSVGGGGVQYVGPFGLLPNGSVKTRIVSGDSTVHALHYYTQRGIKLMARMAVDLGPLLIPDEYRNPGDLRVFAEAAVLGWEDQPFYYEDRMQRIPVMFGMHVPTFKLLDRLTVQAEYYGSRFADTKQYDENSHPIWTITSSYDEADYKRDDWKWSVTGRKTVNRLLTVHAQVANDHLRLPIFTGNPTSTPLTNTPENWYYLLRFETRL